MALGLAAATATAAPPANDNFANALAITSTNGTINGNNALATLEACETNKVYTDNNGVEKITNSVWFAYTATSSGVLKLDTDGSDTNNDYVLAVWKSTNATPVLCDHSLTSIIADDQNYTDTNGNAFSRVFVSVVTNKTYYIQVSSLNDGSSPNDNSGAYVLNWTTITTPPANDNFVSATVLTGNSGVISGDNTLATLEACETNALVLYGLFATPITNSTWYAWTATSSGSLQLSTDGSDPNNNYLLAVWTSTNANPLMCDGSLTNLIADDEDQGPDSSGYNYSAVTISVTASNTYYIEVASFDDGSSPNDNAGAYQLSWSASGPPPDGSFTNSVPLTGNQGIVTWTNVGVVPDPLDPTIAGQTPQNTVWFQWTAPSSGEVALDTCGSVDAVTGLINLDTVLGVYTGSSLATLNEVAANDDLYPVQGSGEYLSAQNIYTFGSTNFADYNRGTTNPPPVRASGALHAFTQPFGGPSGLRFNAVKGVTYNIAVDTKPQPYYPGPGVIVMNLAMHPSGIFRFATENSEQTGLTYSNGTSMLLYQVAATESVAPKAEGGPRSGYTSEYPGALVTITRVAGSCGRVTVNYTTADIGTNSNLLGIDGFHLLNGDLPGVGGTDYTPTSGTLTFDNFEMSKTIAIQVANPNQNVGRPNRDFLVLITNTVPDTNESTAISAPRLDNTFSQALVRILDVYTDPRGVATFINSASNLVYTTRATNAVFNFQKAFYQELRWGSNTEISLYVNRTGTNAAAATVNYTVNSGYPYDKGLGSPNNNEFCLQAGSDYATPDPIDGTHLSKASDFNLPGGYTGTLTFPGNGNTDPQPIQIELYNNGLQQFNEDFQIDLYTLDSNGNPHPVGMVNQCNVTVGNAKDILAALYPPAGAVDEFYNSDYGADFWNSTDPPDMAHPGTDGEVYGLVVQPDGKAIVVGDFSTYDTYGMNNIARATAQGYLDHTFKIGSGADDSISCVLLTTNNEILIGGNFSAFNGQSSSGIALLQTTGALDPGFAPGSGFNGLVSALVLQTNGAIVAGGSFTSYNGVTQNYLARINPDGSLDTSFNPGTNLNAAVYALALQTNGQIVVGGQFTAAGGVAGQNYLARINGDGSLDTAFDPGSGANGAVETVAVQPDGNILLGGDFSEVNGQAMNYIARLNGSGNVDPYFFSGLGVDGPVYDLLVNTNPIYSTADGSLVQSGFTIYVGGAFTEYNGTHRLGFARLNSDGTVDTTYLDPAYNQFAGLTQVYYDDPLGVVNASAILNGTNVLIGGTFDQVGGGDYDSRIRPTSDSGPNLVTGIMRIRSGIRNHSNIASLIGGATPGPGNIALAYPAYSINESAGSMFVGMVRTNGFLGNATANFSVIPGLAQNGVDYAYAGTGPFYTEEWDYRQMHSDGLFGSAAVPQDDFNTAYAGSIQGAVTLSILGNETTTADLKAQLQMANPAGADQFYLGGQNIPLGVGLGESLAPLTLINDYHACGTFGFSASNYVATADTFIPISLVRSNGTYGAVSLNYATVTNGSTAVLNSDYRAASGTVTFNDGTTSQSFSVQVLNTNYISTVEKHVNLALYALQPPADGVAAFGLTNAILRIINANFAGLLNFSLTNYPASVNAGAVGITITRTVGSKGTLGVQLSTSNGTATNGVDYTGIVTNLTWNNGDVSPRTVPVPLLPNNGFGSDRVFYVNLSNSTLNGKTNGTLLLATSATVTITNDLNCGGFQFSATDYTVNETGGYATLTVNRTGTLTDLGFPASVHYFTVNGAAISTNNYLAVSNVLNFAAGQAAASLTVAINNDNVVDPPPAQFYFQVVLSTPSSASALGSPSACNVHIVDAQSYNNPPGQGDTTFNPGSGMNAPVYALAIQTNGLLLAGGAFTTVNGYPITYLARLNADGSPDQSGFLNDLAGVNGPVYSVASQTDDNIVVGGAFTDADGIFRNHIARLLTDGTLDTSFNPGAGADNTVYCLAETFIGGSRCLYVGGAFTTMDRVTSPALVRLQNNGTVDPGFSTGLGPNSTVYAVAVYPTNSPEAGKVLIGGAFSAVNNVQTPYLARLNVDGSVDTQFGAGLALDGNVNAIAIQNDGGIVIGGNFLNAYDSAHGTNAIPAAHLARIYQNTNGVTYLDTTNFAAAMSGGPNGPVNALALQADNRIIVAGNFAQANGITRNNITRLYPNGTMDPTMNFGDGANAAVYAALVQPSDQKIVLGGAFTQFSDLTANYIVRLYGGSDVGPGHFEFGATNYSVAENGRFAPITIRRLDGTSGTNSVYFSTTNSTAFAGTNYYAINQQVVFPPGVDELTVNVPVLDDGVITPNLTVNLLLTNAAASDEPWSSSTATLTIINVDSGVSFSAANYSVPKNTPLGYFNIDVFRLGSAAATNSVTFVTTTNGTANPGVDFTPTNLVVTFNPGQTDQMVSIPILDNPLPTGNLTVDFALTNAVNTVINSPSNAVLTIVDTVRVPGQFTFAFPAYSVTEGGGVGDTDVYITVLRTNGTAGVATVNYATLDGTATAGVKYVPTFGTLTFADGQASTNFFVPVINTTTAEGPESFSVVLSNPTGGASLIAPTNTVVTILNTNTGIAFASATNAFTEPSGTNTGVLLLSVVRFNNTNGTTTVNYSTTNGTAVANTNFLGVSNGVLTFNPGQSVQTIAITTLHDPLVTGDLFFTVGLANPSSGAQLTSPSFTVVTDHDADAGISFLTNAASFYRNAGFAIILVSNTNPNVEPVSVNYATADGSALAGTDYTATNGTLTFTNGLTLNYFLVPILLNNSVLTNRTFTVTLSSPTPPGVLVPPTTETVTIIGTNTPPGLSFYTPIILGGSWGATNLDNTLGAPEAGDPTIAGQAPNAPVWFQWTAPSSGEVSLDTIGSLGTNGMMLDTVLAVFTGSSLSGLNQMAANDDLYPNKTAIQINNAVQAIYDTNFDEFFETSFDFYQPFTGPSGLRFNATAGATYFIAVDTKPTSSLAISNGVIVSVIGGRGPIELNWAYHSSGVFRFASENVDQTFIISTNVNPTLLYQCSETESGKARTIVGIHTVFEPDTTMHTYYYYNTPGLLVTVTRVAGSAGRASVDYATQDGDPNVIGNGDNPAIGGVDYTPVSGTLIFDDYEMSKTFLVPIIDDGGISQPNRDFTVLLSNPQRDPQESSQVSAPRVDSVFGQVACRILDCDIDPHGPSRIQVVNTNVTPPLTNYLTSLVPTNAVFNFEKSNYRVPHDAGNYWKGTPITVYVNRMGTNNSSVTLTYRIDNYYLSQTGTIEDSDVDFILQPGSDYATPPSDSPVVFPASPEDFQANGGETGTLSFPSGNDYNWSVPIHFTVYDVTNTEFNKDWRIELYGSDAKGNPTPAGMVAEATVTILFNDYNPPAGSLDEFYNPDFGSSMAVTNEIGSDIPNPGTEPDSEVYSLVVLTNNQTVIAGAFRTYTDGNTTHTVNGIARLNPDGSLDTTFTPSSGVNVDPGGQFIRSVALSGSQLVIGGDFTSYSGSPRNNVARLAANGLLDPTFNPGTGANGTVWSVLVQADGRVLIGGEFTSYNGVPANHIARLNTDGSLDTTFNASNLITGPVYAMALPADSPLNFTHAGNRTNQDTQTINLGLQTTGILNVTLNSLTGINEMQIYYGTANVAAGTGALLYDSGATFTGTANFALPFGPVNGLVTNLITVVMNPGGQPTGPSPWSYNLYMAGSTNVMIGGQFNVSGQSYANLAQLNPDGSLDTAFSPGTGPNGAVHALAWQEDGHVVAGGSFNIVSGISFNNLVRLNADGSIDSTYNNGTGTDNTVYSLTLQPVSVKLYVGGPFTVMNGTHRLGFARLNPDGSVDTSFLDTAYNQFAGLPRIFYNDPPGTVYASGIQGDGNVVIAGSFQEVGGGQADSEVRNSLELDRGLQESFADTNLWVSEEGQNIEPKTRDGVRIRGNVARLIGGATPGPGNIGLASTGYAANRTQSGTSVNLVRTNGSLGYASANFAVQSGLAHSGSDYSYDSVAPLYPIEWEYSTLQKDSRFHADGWYGGNYLLLDNYGNSLPEGVNGPASVNVGILSNPSSSGSLSAAFQLANPNADLFYLGGQLIPVGVALGISAAPFTLVDNGHQDGVFGFAAPSYAATNSPVAVVIARTNGSSGTVQMNYQTVTNGSTAVLGVDYTPARGVVTFAPAQTSGSFPVTILNNSSVSAQEKTVNVQLYNLHDLSGGNAQFGLTNAVVRLINPNYPGFLNLNTNAYFANLSAGVITFTVTRTVGSLGTATVQYRTADITAHNGTNYVGVTNTLTWNSGDVSPRTISIRLKNINQTGPVLLFAANLFNPTLNGASAPGLLGGTTSATFFIINDNTYGTFQFSSPSYQFNDGSNALASITVTRSGSALSTASVNYSTLNGTALAGVNYVGITNNTLTFTNGQVAQSFNVRLLDDGSTNDPAPANFYFSVDLSNPSAGAYLNPSFTNTVVHLVHGEQYNQPPGSVDPSYTASVNGIVQALALQTNGQVVAGGSFTVADGTSINRIARFNTDGTLDDGFLYDLAGADGTVNAVVSQTDDRVVVGGSFANVNSVMRLGIARLMTDGSLDTSFNPGAGADNTVFALAESFVNGTRVIYVGGGFDNFNGTASPGLVRLNNSGAVDSSFAVGQGVAGTVYALAVYPTNSVYYAGDVLVGGAFTNYNNFGVGNLVRLNPNGTLDTNFNQNALANGPVRAIAIQLDGSVLIGGEFTNVNGGAANNLARLTPTGALDPAFTAAAAPGVTGSVSALALQQDNRIVVGGQFNDANGVTRNDLTRLLPTGAVDATINFGAGANGAVNAVVIQPTDGNLVIGGGFTQFNGQSCDHIARLFGGSESGSGAFQFTSANYQVAENGSFATITIERTGGTSGPNADGSGDVSVTFSTADGTATNGLNYTGTTNSVPFPAGEVLETVTVPVLNNTNPGPNLTVDLNLSNPSPGTSLGNQATAVLTILNDNSQVQFAEPSYSVQISANGLANIPIIRVGSASGSCSVNFATTTNGTAVIGTDYYPTNALITFAPGVMTNFIQVPVLYDTNVAGSTVTMMLTNALNAALAAPFTAVLNITDNTTNPGDLFFSATNFGVYASAGYALLPVTRANGSAGAASVYYTTVPGTAVPGVDYTPVTNELEFAAGDTTEFCRIPVINNRLAQEPVSLSVYLFNASGAGLIAPTNAILTITNNTAVFAFTQATNTAAENQGSVSLVVQRFNNSSIVSSVNYTTINGTAVANTNFIGVTNGVLTFGVGQMFAAISVPLINQTNYLTLAFGVDLSSPVNGQLVAPSNTVVLLEPSAAGVTFTTNATSVLNSAGAVPITVVCLNPAIEPLVINTNSVPLEVNYTTVDGSARAGYNYNAVSGTLVFTNGLGTNTFYVPILNSQFLSSNLTFSVILTNVTPPGVIAPYGTQTVAIVEGSAGVSFSQANYNVFDNTGLATITVNRTGFTNSTSSVDYFVTNGTAIGGQNFYPTSGTLLFTNGVTSQSFNVTLITNTLAEPNLFALMGLLNPTNAQIVNPGAATLTILDTGSSYIIPAGAQVQTNSTSQYDYTNNVIGSNDTVTVLFAFRDAAGLNVTNLGATLLATNGVSAPSPASNSYGPLTVYGHSVSRAYTFTALGTNAFTISPTFQLTTDGKSAGVATFVFTLGTWTTTFANTNPIIIRDDEAASPYPSIIDVSGLGSSLVKATVTLTNLSHQNLSDVDALVVSPGTSNTLIMSHVGAGFPANHLVLTFDDFSTNTLPKNTAVVSGTNKPTQYNPPASFP